MWSRVLRRLLLCSAIVALFLCLAPKLAHAQAVISVYQETSLPRVGVDDKGNAVVIQKRPINLTPEGVNNQDCVDNLSIRFPVQLSNFAANGTLEAWAGLSGESCSSNTSRTSANRVCWKLVSGIGLSLQTTNVDIPVRTIMSGIKSATSPDASAAICGTVDLTTVSVNFVYFAPGQTNEASATKTVSVQVDTVGPAAPTGLRVLPGNTRLIMNWDNISGEGGVSVLTGIRVYCDPNHSAGIPDVPACKALIRERSEVGSSTTTTTTTDAGTDAGTDGGDAEAGTEDAAVSVTDAGTSTGVDGSSVGTGGSCESANLAPSSGSFSPTSAFNDCFSCGSLTGNSGTAIVASSLRGAPLENGTVYFVAVAATDAFDNVGPLSRPTKPLCEYPELTNDFWADYKNAGGDAGGGCSTTGETPVGTLAVLGASAAIGLSSARRRRKATVVKGAAR